MRCGGDEAHATATFASATPRARCGTDCVTQKCVTQNRAGTRWDGDGTGLSLRGFFRHPTSCPYRGIPPFFVDPALFRANIKSAFICNGQRDAGTVSNAKRQRMGAIALPAAKQFSASLCLCASALSSSISLTGAEAAIPNEEFTLVVWPF